MGRINLTQRFFATSFSLPSLLYRSFIFCCSSEVETQIAAGGNKQISSYSIINKVVPAAELPQRFA